MSEQIQVAGDTLYILFESGAVKYHDGLDRIPEHNSIEQACNCLFPCSRISESRVFVYTWK